MSSITAWVLFWIHVAPCGSTNKMTNTKKKSPLLRVKPCYETLFPNPEERPSFRTFLEWKKRRYFPQIKIGGNVLLNPDDVRAAIEKRFTIPAAR